MPAQFDDFGIRFLYPDNWQIAEREENEGDRGATLDLPGGGFFSIERTDAAGVKELVDGLVETIAADYEGLERDDCSWEAVPEGTSVTELRFYYLDLLIVSRLVVVPAELLDQRLDDEVLVIQMQAESRDFDKNEPVFAAIMKQIVEN